jgi:hypothetical protein
LRATVTATSPLKTQVQLVLKHHLVGRDQLTHFPSTHLLLAVVAVVVHVMVVAVVQAHLLKLAT